MKKLLLFIFFTGLLFLSTAAPSFAQQIGFSIYPPILETVIKPGKTITQAFTISNLSETDRVVVARVVPFAPEGETGFPLLRPDLRPSWLSYFSLANSFISLGEPFVLGGLESDQLVLTIAIPSNAKEADYYSTLILTTNLDQPSEEQTGNSTINTTIGANLLLTVNNRAYPPTVVRISEFYPLADDYLFRLGDVYFADNLNPIRFHAIAKNSGRYLTKIGGLLRVSRNDTAISLQGLIPHNLLADSSREIQGSPSGELVFTPKLINIGPYKVALDLRSENSSSHTELTIFLLPLKGLFGLLIGLILMFSIIKISFKTSVKSPLLTTDRKR